MLLYLCNECNLQYIALSLYNRVHSIPDANCEIVHSFNFSKGTFHKLHILYHMTISDDWIRY